MNEIVRNGAAFVGLYLLMLAVLVRPQMNFNMYIKSFFLQADYSAVMVLTYRFDAYMALVAAPLSGGTVYALTQWNIQCENPNARKTIITAVVCSYILVLSVNFLANVMVLQQALVRFDQCPRQAWPMYCHMAGSFIKSALADMQSVITRQHVKRVRLTYRLR
ncbi:uncharacterized protein [Drosophila kikkawai]|uniref:G-protein coupled receptors family 1 profile domain-containing protein n=1 Tax=Drosophila kikkawai TaxID=30033 RepID=A0A6P4ILK8_DROKI|nr:uncharacterized protein LOC108075459 [Drosophila kikkawai]